MRERTFVMDTRLSAVTHARLHTFTSSQANSQIPLILPLPINPPHPPVPPLLCTCCSPLSLCTGTRYAATCLPGFNDFNAKHHPSQITAPFVGFSSHCSRFDGGVFLVNLDFTVVVPTRLKPWSVSEPDIYVYVLGVPALRITVTLKGLF